MFKNADSPALLQSRIIGLRRRIAEIQRRKAAGQTAIGGKRCDELVEHLQVRLDSLLRSQA